MGCFNKREKKKSVLISYYISSAAPIVYYSVGQQCKLIFIIRNNVLVLFYGYVMTMTCLTSQEYLKSLHLIKLDHKRALFKSAFISTKYRETIDLIWELRIFFIIFFVISNKTELLTSCEIGGRNCLCSSIMIRRHISTFSSLSICETIKQKRCLKQFCELTTQ